MQIFGNRNLLSVIRECLYFSISPSKSITPWIKYILCCSSCRHKLEIKFAFIVTSLEFGLFKESFREEFLLIKKEDQQKYIKFVTTPLNFSCVLYRL